MQLACQKDIPLMRLAVSCTPSIPAVATNHSQQSSRIPGPNDNDHQQQVPLRSNFGRDHNHLENWTPENFHRTLPSGISHVEYLLLPRLLPTQDVTGWCFVPSPVFTSLLQAVEFPSCLSSSLSYSHSRQPHESAWGAREGWILFGIMMLKC